MVWIFLSDLFRERLKVDLTPSFMVVEKTPQFSKYRQYDELEYPLLTETRPMVTWNLSYMFFVTADSASWMPAKLL